MSDLFLNGLRYNESIKESTEQVLRNKEDKYYA